MAPGNLLCVFDICGYLVNPRRRPRQDSNLCSWLRRPVLYPLSYGDLYDYLYHICSRFGKISCPVPVPRVIIAGMYLDRSYRPRRRRGKGRYLWPMVLLVVIGIILYEQQPTWLIPRQIQPTAVPTRSAVSYLADAEDRLANADYDGAVSAYVEMAQLEPDNAMPLVELSGLYLLLQDLPRAYQYAQRAYELEPEDPRAITAFAHASDWVGEYEASLNLALDALEIDPEHADALAVLAEVYTDVGNWDVAQDYLDQAFELEPNNILALRNQAYLYERRGDYETAVSAYNRAIELAPTRFDLYIERGRQYRVGLLEYELANQSYQEAVDVYESAITLDALGFGLYNIGDHLQAVRVLRNAVELDPNFGPAQVHLGMALYARRNYEDAVPSLEKGVQLLGDDARIEHIYTLGLAYIYKEPTECDKAAVWLRKALEIDPETGPAIEGLNLCLQ